MQSSKLVWILEDDPGCVFVYQEILDIRFHTKYFDKIEDFNQALHERDEDPSLIIADLKLKDGCFLNYLSSCNRTELYEIPFMVISSINDIDALRFCFDEGALDYLTKPFKKTEFIVKVERALNSTSKKYIREEPTTPISIIEQFSELNLTNKEQNILKQFLDRDEGSHISREDLLESVWKDTTVHPKTLDVHLYNLRRKLNKKGIHIAAVDRGHWMLISNNRIIS